MNRDTPFFNSYRYRAQQIYNSLSTPAKVEQIREAEKQGMIPKEKLVNDRYYLGESEEAEIARWDGERQLFWFLKHRIADVTLESVEHPEDDKGMDVFVPVLEIMPEAADTISDKNIKMALLSN